MYNFHIAQTFSKYSLLFPDTLEFRNRREFIRILASLTNAPLDSLGFLKSAEHDPTSSLQRCQPPPFCKSCVTHQHPKVASPWLNVSGIVHYFRYYCVPLRFPKPKQGGITSLPISRQFPADAPTKTRLIHDVSFMISCVANDIITMLEIWNGPATRFFRDFAAGDAAKRKHKTCATTLLYRYSHGKTLPCGSEELKAFTLGHVSASNAYQRCKASIISSPDWREGCLI